MSFLSKVKIRGKNTKKRKLFIKRNNYSHFQSIGSMQENSILLEDQHPKLNGGSNGVPTTYSSFRPIFPDTTAQIKRIIRCFTAVAIMNAALSLVWLGLVIWIGIKFAGNADYSPNFILSFFPVFMIVVVGLDVEFIPLVIIIRSLRNSQLAPFPSVQVSSNLHYLYS
jgi:hypothetical protein